MREGLRMLTGSDVQQEPVREVDGEPRMQDLELGVRAGYTRPRTIRTLIERMQVEGAFSEPICCTVQHISARGHGRAAKVYWLTEAEALLVLMRCGTPTANAVAREVVAVFVAWRRGHLAPANGVGMADLVALEGRLEVRDACSFVLVVLREADALEGVSEDDCARRSIGSSAVWCRFSRNAKWLVSRLWALSAALLHSRKRKDA